MPDDARDPAASLLNALSSLRVDRSSGQPARHLPIALLWAIGRAANQQNRLVSWHEAQQELQPLFETYSRHGFASGPEYPFVALGQSGLGEFSGAQGEIPVTHGPSLRSWLGKQDPKAGLESAAYELLASNQTVRDQAVEVLLDTYFSSDTHRDLLKATRLAKVEFDGYGHPPRIPKGAEFKNRKALAAADVHRPIQSGIWGKEKEEAKSIVVSGGYEDDQDYGDKIIYTGQGGQDESGRQVRDQTLTRGNAALVNSIATGRPIRVIRGARGNPDHSPKSGLRYDGLFRVEQHWSQRGKSGFLVWRYHLSAVKSTDENAAINASHIDPPSQEKNPGKDSPERKATITQRIVRSTEVANHVKQLHDHTCQVCGTRIETPTGAYSEAAHIRPLGRPHDGPDRTNNVLCLCPNHHVAFDFGMITIDSNRRVIEHGSAHHGYVLREHPQHLIDDRHLAYHREHHEENNPVANN
ncbi:YDG/SRA domain-containing protein [Streptomyces sp. NPDC050610]|uniref:YDG/SRA domain-containing protein n=1 Tax=Streptomyces sp. NPDC050610 TaxID=3157097 RepID=UPI00342E135E